MLIFIIILAVLAVVTCFISAIMNARIGNYGVSLLMTILVGINTYILITNINELNNPQDKVETHVVRNVKEYYVDSTTVINGADTTKTYTITYLK